MDLNEFRSLYESAGVDIWTMIDMAITVASIDFCKEFKTRRDQIAERLFATTTTHCLNCDADGAILSASKIKLKHKSPLGMEESNEEDDSHGGEMQNFPPHTPHNDENEEFSDEELKESQEEDNDVKVVLRIKELLEDSDQPHHVLLEALESLDSMHISVEALKETDIGRQVNGLRKHSSTEIKKLVKKLIRKWKDLVDEWVNTAGEVATAAIVDGNSPQAGGNGVSQQTSLQEPHRSNYRPSPQEKDSNCTGRKTCIESDSKGNGLKPGSAHSANNPKAGDWSPDESPQLISGDVQRSRNQMKLEGGLSQKSSLNVSSSEKLASSRKRLQEKYQEAQNAKRQRTVQMMDLQDIPKSRNTFIPHGRGGNQSKHRFNGK
uniref:TFIIS N-terminal domain-containing protein n=1 Tax=Araucaria cunninghamii TaxID=56994 RepID=A0A0D6R376_ARACU